MPYYKFLKGKNGGDKNPNSDPYGLHEFDLEPEFEEPMLMGSVNLTIKNKLQFYNVSVPIYRLLFNPNGTNQECKLSLWFIDRPDNTPHELAYLKYAFQAENPLGIYPTPNSLPISNDQKDLYFIASAIKLLESSTLQFFSDTEEDPISNSVLHLHGATNALVQLAREGTFHTVYTMHDDSFEFDFTLSCADLSFFQLNLSDCKLASRDRVRVSLHALKHASVITTVSQETRNLLLFEAPGSMKLNPFLRQSKELFTQIQSILRWQRGVDSASFLAIENGIEGPYSLVDYPTSWTPSIEPLNPFTNPTLVRLRFNFNWPPYSIPTINPITLQKKSLKLFLLRDARIFLDNEEQESEEDEIWVLFIGRFTFEKGIEDIVELVETIDKSIQTIVRVILMGQEYGSGLSWLIRKLKKYLRKDSTFRVKVSIQDNPRWQANWGVAVRAASDLAFVPSRSESFGLVALEALLFGMPVLSTGIGGLEQFLSEGNFFKNTSILDESRISECQGVFSTFGSSNTTLNKECFKLAVADRQFGNAYLYDIDRKKGENSLSQAFTRFYKEHYGDGGVFYENPHEKEIHHWRCILSALYYSWHRIPDGPLQAYYQKAYLFGIKRLY